MRTPRRFVSPARRPLRSSFGMRPSSRSTPMKFLSGIPPRVFDEKRSVAAAEFDFQRLRFGKQFRQVQRLDDGAQLDDQIFRLSAWVFKSSIVNLK